MRNPLESLIVMATVQQMVDYVSWLAKLTPLRCFSLSFGWCKEVQHQMATPLRRITDIKEKLEE
jgi:hypothetical protein